MYNHGELLRAKVVKIAEVYTQHQEFLDSVYIAGVFQRRKFSADWFEI